MQPCKPTIPYPPFQYFGGKWEQAPWIVSHLPPGQTFVMPFGGAASPLWHIEPGTYPVEVYNDLDGSMVRFFRACRHHPEDLAMLALLTPVSRLEWDLCRQDNVATDDLESARRWLTVARQSRCGAWGRSWSNSVTHSRRGMGSSNSKWLNLPEVILATAARMSSVQIECKDALEIIQQYDRPETVFYCDPPYHPDTRQSGSRDVYHHEMSSDDHVRLLNLLRGVSGKVVLSGYRCGIYDEALGDWGRVDREVPCRSNINNRGGTGSKPTRTESLWMNFNSPTDS